MPVINNLRKTGQNVPDIKIQLDVFDEQRESDEVQSLQDPDGINLNSHLEVFYAILRQVLTNSSRNVVTQRYRGSYLTKCLISLLLIPLR